MDRKVLRAGDVPAGRCRRVRRVFRPSLVLDVKPHADAERPMGIVVLIPAYRPDSNLLEVVSGLASTGAFDGILVVDDGSGADHMQLFERIRPIGGVHLLRHHVNLGKGAALKTGMRFALDTYPDLQGIVTADADGQHRPSDISRVGRRFQEHPDALVLGTRRFEGTVPLRSRIGNVITRFVFRVLVGWSLHDTQTGLRAVPAALARDLLGLRSERYEFETEMLVLAARSGRRYVEEPIETVYIERNAGSHFRPFRDSLRIYLCLLRAVVALSPTVATDDAIRRRSG